MNTISTDRNLLRPASLYLGNLGGNGAELSRVMVSSTLSFVSSAFSAETSLRTADATSTVLAPWNLNDVQPRVVWPW